MAGRSRKNPYDAALLSSSIKAGLSSREAIARFDSERQALALMDHPVIAKVFSTGATPGGEPYFAMEYVAGVPITDYCDKHKLNTRERLELFTQVCEGVQHAHQKAIIHRDLKPSNILVTEVDGHPAAKIIDFGVAKALTQRLTEETMFTRAGAMLGTPEYMSPEQASFVRRRHRHPQRRVFSRHHFLRIACGRTPIRAAQGRAGRVPAPFARGGTAQAQHQDHHE